MYDELTLRPEQAILVLIDWQERLEPAMEAGRRERARRGAATLLEAAGLLGMPALVTEQYPKGLGPTIESLSTLHRAIHPYHATIAKTCFAATDSKYFSDQLAALRRRTVILAGMEAHICVWQTARALRRAGYAVHVAADALLSRTAENREIGVELMRGVGCTITSTEAAIYDLIGGADHPSFRAISALLR